MQKTKQTETLNKQNKPENGKQNKFKKQRKPKLKKKNYLAHFSFAPMLSSNDAPKRCL